MGGSENAGRPRLRLLHGSRARNAAPEALGDDLGRKRHGLLRFLLGAGLVRLQALLDGTREVALRSLQ